MAAGEFGGGVMKGDVEMQIPSEWVDALSAIQAVIPDAVIGGGCLRDLDNGRPVKDIDVFISGSGAGHLYSAREQLVRSGFDCDDIDETTMYPIGDGNDLIGFINVLFPNVDYPVQLIMTNWDTSRITDRFDYGICRISFDGTTLFRADTYNEDQRNQVFKLRRERYGEELSASVHRYARLVQKYEGWKFRPFDDFGEQLVPAAP